jgi:hypothetical protein
LRDVKPSHFSPAIRFAFYKEQRHISKEEAEVWNGFCVKPLCFSEAG